MNRAVSGLGPTLAVLLLSLCLLGVSVAPALAAKGIGLIIPLCCGFGQETRDRFNRELQMAGLQAGEFELLLQTPGVDKVSLVNSIRKVVAYEARALVVFGATAAREAVREVRNIPIIVIGAYDPVGAGLAQSLERPGGTVTGIFCRTSLPFLLDNIQKTAGSVNLGVVYHSDSLDSRGQLSELQAEAVKRNLKTTVADLKGSTPQAVGSALQGSQFVYLAAGCYPEFIGPNDLSGIGKPVATQCPLANDPMTVFSLAPDPDEVMSEAARLTVRVIGGEKPGNIPFSLVKKINFTVNVGAAQRLGLRIPFDVLGQATKVVK